MNKLPSYWLFRGYRQSKSSLPIGCFAVTGSQKSSLPIGCFLRLQVVKKLPSYWLFPCYSYSRLAPAWQARILPLNHQCLTTREKPVDSVTRRRHACFGWFWDRVHLVGRYYSAGRRTRPLQVRMAERSKALRSGRSLHWRRGFESHF